MWFWIGGTFGFVLLITTIIILHHVHIQEIKETQNVHKRWLIDISSRHHEDEEKNNKIFLAMLQSN
jgi:predicted tellurium resistance membrane protein TerC